jgi:hypothetical protein
MCPACITTVTIAVVGSTSAGGLAALIARKLRARKSGKISGQLSVVSDQWSEGNGHRRPTTGPPATDH